MERTTLHAALALLSLWFLLGYARRAAGRAAPRATFAPMVFLFTRTPVLVAWALGAAGMLALVIPGAVAHGHTGPGDLALLVGISAFCGLGFGVLAVGPVFMLMRASAPAPVLPLEPGEMLLHELLANHFLGGEARGGRLLVTTRRLAFRPHRFNVQNECWSARLDELVGFGFEGERFLLVATAAKKDPEWVVTARPQQIASYVDALRGVAESERERMNEGARADAGLPPTRRAA